MNTGYRQVKITHVINPSRFYYRDLLNADQEQDKIDEFEKELQSFASSRKFMPSLQPEFKKGDVRV
jgi:hypothetical protein